ncbi:hypothetical protein [Paenibacillus sedimenti]|uniref:Uncharacterized protein n=1 Tax=Paenibacillus sedimenti TaxID=2770274 RepID=A0A926KPK3_9BACL|nr:hypothetical protein [Paenibacillus sedimenti]MBD0379790.1 hypothetical protein [Paenibacillus sedimenti]
MDAFETVYCVGCNSIVSKFHAECVFKTGYYKVKIPLAHCKSCAHKDCQKENILMDSPTGYMNYRVDLPLLA